MRLLKCFTRTLPLFLKEEKSLRGFEIKTKIDRNNKMIEQCLSPNQFTLNNVVKDLLKENDELQAKCPHEFEEGYCIYCYKSEGK